MSEHTSSVVRLLMPTHYKGVVFSVPEQGQEIASSVFGRLTWGKEGLEVVKEAGGYDDDMILRLFEPILGDTAALRRRSKRKQSAVDRPVWRHASPASWDGVQKGRGGAPSVRAATSATSRTRAPRVRPSSAGAHRTYVAQRSHQKGSSPVNARSSERVELVFTAQGMKSLNMAAFNAMERRNESTKRRRNKKSQVVPSALATRFEEKRDEGIDIHGLVSNMIERVMDDCGRASASMHHHHSQRNGRSETTLTGSTAASRAGQAPEIIQRRKAPASKLKPWKFAGSRDVVPTNEWRPLPPASAAAAPAPADVAAAASGSGRLGVALRRVMSAARGSKVGGGKKHKPHVLHVGLCRPVSPVSSAKRHGSPSYTKKGPLPDRAENDPTSQVMVS